MPDSSFHVYGAFDRINAVSGHLTPRAPSASEGNGTVGVNLSYDFSGSVVLQTRLASSAAGTNWDDAVVYSTGGAYTVASDGTKQFRLQMRTLTAGRAAYDLLSTTLSDAISNQEDAYHRALALRGSVGGVAQKNSIFADAIYNVKASNTRRIRAAVSNPAINPVICCIGDSEVLGQSTGGGSSQGVNAWPQKLADFLSAAGVPASAGSVFGLGNYRGTGSTAGWAAADNRISGLTGTIPSFGSEGPGGLLFAAGAAAGFTFTPPTTGNYVDVVYGAISGGGTFNVQVDGDTATAISTNATAALVRTNIRSALTVSTHAVSWSWVSGNVRPIGFIVYNNSAAKRDILIFNLGISGAQASGFQFQVAGQPYTRQPGMIALAPNLVVHNLGLKNNQLSAISAATTYNDCRLDLLDALNNGSDAAIIIPVYDSSDQANQDMYAAIAYRLADELDIPVIDIHKLWLSYNNAVSDNLMADLVHPNSTGYNMWGRLIARALIQILGY